MKVNILGEDFQKYNKLKVAMLTLLLFLIVTQTSCVNTSYIGDKIKQMTGTNSGTLTAAPGTRLADLRRDSSLDIGAGVGSMVETSKRRTFQQSKRFDWQLPDSKLQFKSCNSYSIYTDETGETVVDMQIGTAQKYLTWAEVKTEMLDIERHLLNDGWQPVIERDGSNNSEILHHKLEKPDFNQFDDVIAGSVYKKGDVDFTFMAKRARGQGKPDIAEGQNFLHYVITDIARNKK